MTDRCKIGDIAIIIKDNPGCEANIGRLVRVCGPQQFYEMRGTVWLIEPVVGTTITYVHDRSRKVLIGEAIGIEHEDDWLLPIRPEPEGDAVDVATELTLETEAV